MLSDKDILLARSGSVGKSFIYQNDYGPSVFAGYLIRARIDESKALPEYIYFVTLSKYFELWKDRISIQTTIPNISAEKYNNLPIILPDLEDQRRIVQYISQETNSIDEVVIHIEKTIHELAEFKSHLISDVVTGKIDVRGIEIPDYEYVADETDTDSNEDANIEETDEQEE